MNDEPKRPEAQKGAFFQDINPTRQFFYDTKALNLDNPSFLDEEGRVNNQSQLRQSFLNGLGGELGNISVIGPQKIPPEQSIDVGNKADGGNILDGSLLKERALFQPATKFSSRENQTKQEYPHKIGEKNSNGKGTKYMQFEDSEDQIEDQVHPTFKQYEDDDIDLEYNFNNLLNNIENLNPELLPQNPTPQNNQEIPNNVPQIAADQNPQANVQSQAPASLPEIPEEELSRIYDSYIDIYKYLLLFYIGLLAINFEVVPPFTVFGILWAVEILVFWKKIKEFRATPPENKANRRKSMALAVECVLYAMCKVYIMFSLEVNPKLYMTYTIAPCLSYAVILCVIIGTVATSVDIAWLVLRFLFWLQMLMVYLKLDNLIEWDWRGVFWLFWFVFFLVVFYCAGLVLVLACLLYFLIVRQIQGYQFCGLLWLLIFLAGNSGVVFGIITGFVNEQENPSNQALLIYTILGGIAQQLFMMIFSRLLKKQLKDFFVMILRSDTNEHRKTRKEVTYEREQERGNYPGFLIMFSPTYFMTYEQKIKLKKQRPTFLARLKSKKYEKTHAKRPEMMAKNILKGMELITSTNKNLISPPTLGDRMSDRNAANNSTGSTNKFIFIPMNKGADEVDQKPSAANSVSGSIQIQQLNPSEKVLKIKKNILNKSCIDTRAIEFAEKQLQREKIVEKLEKYQSSKGQEKEGEEADKKKNNNLTQVLNGDNEKSVLSEGDAEYVEGGQNLSQMFSIPSPNKQIEGAKAKEEPCNVCFDKPPDAVLMSCGHGGLCYECALMIWKKSLECYMCRKIDSNSKKWGITKVIGSTKMVFKDVEYSQEHSRGDDSQFGSSLSPT